MKKTLNRFLLILLIATALDFISTGIWSRRIVHSFQSSISKVPAAIVLMGDFDNETGELGSETRRRLNHALRLRQEGKTDYILCVGGARPRFSVFGSESMRQFLIDEGVPAKKVLLEKQSFDSRTNWQAAYEIIRDHEWGTVAIISSPFHLYRFRKIADDSPKKHLRMFFSPYSLRQSQPRITYFDIWKQVHYEWLACLSKLLPDVFYEKLINHIRGQ